MITTDPEEYIDQVLEHLPSELESRDEIALEIRSTIEERLANGQKLYQVLDQLGEPLELAESYLQDLPMESASFGARVVAKLIDLAIPAAAIFLFMRWQFHRLESHIHEYRGGIGLFLGIGLLIQLMIWSTLIFYPALAEWRFERTLGKEIMGLRVARESGARISLGQSLLRHLPWLLPIVWVVDACFPLFTEKQQRAAELLSHTRTVEKQ